MADLKIRVFMVGEAAFEFVTLAWNRTKPAIAQ